MDMISLIILERRTGDLQLINSLPLDGILKGLFMRENGNTSKEEAARSFIISTIAIKK